MKTTTLSLDDDLLQAVESEVSHTGQTPGQVIARVLRDVFLERNLEKPFKLRWVTVGGELQPGVDLDSRDLLIEKMEGRS